MITRARVAPVSFLPIIVLVAAALVAAGCGKQSSEGGSSGGDGNSGGDGPKIGLVTDLGGLSDRSFNQLANEGLEQAEGDLGAVGTVLESKSAADYEKNLGQLAQQDQDLIVGVGFLMADGVKAVAEKAPDANFLIIDYTYADDSGAWAGPANVRGILFEEQQAGYLAGTLAGMVEQDGKLKGLNKDLVVSAVGGQKVPPVERFIAGYEAGVKAHCSGCTVLIDYSQDFIDQAKCQDRALAQIARGSDIVFQVAGQCGLGALDAAKQQGVWGVGVDADQSHLGPHILTSAIKRVDVAVHKTIETVAAGSFEGGAHDVYGLAEDGVGIGPIAPAAKPFEAKVAQEIAKITAGEIEIPTSPSK